MKINKKNDILIIDSQEVIIKDVNSANDLIATAFYEYECNKVVISKELIIEEFFDLSTRIAGEILQKFITYKIKIAIYGDFTKYTSNALKDFIRESNNGKDIFFLKNEKECIDKLENI